MGRSRACKRKRETLGTIRRIPDDLWMEVQSLLPPEKRGMNGRGNVKLTVDEIICEKAVDTGLLARSVGHGSACEFPS